MKTYRIALAILLGTILVGFVATTLNFAINLKSDSHDNFLFISQSRRLTDAEYQNVPFAFTRARTLVGILAGYETVFKAITGKFPTMEQYHAPMPFVTALCVLVWVGFGKFLFGTTAGIFCGLFLVANFQFMRMAPYTGVDIICTLLVGVFLWGFAAFIKELESPTKAKRINLLAVGIGVSAALLSMSKYIYFYAIPPLLIGFVLLHLFLPALRGKLKGTAVPFGFMTLTYLLVNEIGQRSLGIPEHGLWFNLNMFLHYRGLNTNNFKFIPPTVYFEEFVHAYGIVFLTLLGALTVMLFVRRREFSLSFNWKTRSMILLLGFQTLLLGVLLTLKHKEGRYLLPIIPGVLLFTFWGVDQLSKRMRPRFAMAWLSLWVVALIHPLRQSHAEMKTLERIVADPRQQEMIAFWDYLRTPTITGRKCHYVYACDFLAANTDFNLPSYFYEMPKSILNIDTCKNISSHLKVKAKDLNHDFNRDTCFVYPENKTSLSEFTSVVVRKNLGSGLSQRDVERLQSIGSEINCQGDSCFSLRHFFKEKAAGIQVGKAAPSR